MKNSDNNNSGFTLLELLITISIVGILTSLAAPSFSTFIQDRKLEAILNDFRSGLVMTRSESVKRGQRTVICASSNGTSCNGSAWTEGWLSFVDDDADDTKDASEEILLVGSALESDFSLLGSVDVTDAIRYEPDGESLETGAVTLCGPQGASHAEALIITPSGKARASDSGLGGAALTC